MIDHGLTHTPSGGGHDQITSFIGSSPKLDPDRRHFHDNRELPQALATKSPDTPAVRSLAAGTMCRRRPIRIGAKGRVRKMVLAGLTKA